MVTIKKHLQREKVFTNTILLLFITFFSMGEIRSQDNSHRRLTSMQNHRKNLKKSPALSQELAKIESHISSFVARKKTKNTKIPLVFHVIHNGNEGIVTEEHIIQQVIALNRDFSLSNFKIAHQADTLEGFSKLKPHKMDIDFCFAKFKNNSNQSAINYYNSDQKEWKPDDSMKFRDRGGADALDTDSYVNIWILKLDSTSNGYAQLPGLDKKTDGIVIDYRYFGIKSDNNPRYNEGKTLTHLIGNYLGLHDLWGVSHCADDNVEDTPIHNGPNYVCPDYKHVTTCDGNKVEMTMNFMDNTDDSCLRMFTLGQMLRIHAMVDKDGPRGNLRKTKVVCEDSFDEMFVDVEPRTEHDVHLQRLDLFPNPTHTILNLVISSDLSNIKFKYQILNSSGIEVMRNDLVLKSKTTEMQIDVKQLLSGVYYLKGSFGNGKKVSRQFIVVQN